MNEELTLNLCQDYGGLAVIAGFIVSVVYLIIVMSIENTVDIFGTDAYWLKLLGFAIGIIIIGIVCFIDDKKGGVHPLIKLMAQTIAAIVMLISGVRIDGLDIAFINNATWSDAFYNILTIGWIVGITNAINLIDGLDGLSTGVTIIASISLLIIFALNGAPLIAIILITALAGALIGFLPYNFNPAKTFIGDVGSDFLGFALAVISILGVAKTYTAIVIVAPLIVLALPVFDTLWAIIRRIIKGKSLKAIIMPDRGHLHHKMLDKGYSQKQVVLILYGISATFGMFAVILLESGIWKAISFALMIVAAMAIGYHSMFKLKEEEKD